MRLFRLIALWFFRVEKVNEETGTVLEYTKSTTELSTVEFIEYMDQVQQWASEEFDVYLPDPGEQIELMIG